MAEEGRARRGMVLAGENNCPIWESDNCGLDNERGNGRDSIRDSGGDGEEGKG